MPRGPVNRHDGLRDGDLPRRYLRRHEHADLDEDVDPLDGLEIDEYWDPRNEATALDFQLVSVWQDVVAIGYAPSIELPDSIVRSSPARPPSTELGAAGEAPDAIAERLFEHVQRITSQATLERYLESTQRADALEQVRSAGRRFPELFRWFEQRRGPGVILVLLAPFWIRSLDGWSAPVTDDIDAVGRSVIDHLLLQYPVPGSLYQPWRSAGFPGLKWVTWLTLLGRGASLRRAGSRFGWSVSPGLARHFFAAPATLQPIEALMWAEIMRLGGSRVELDRVLQHPAYLYDPTASTVEPELVFADEQRAGREDPQRHRVFWQSTIVWLARHRDQLDDETCEVILDWAMHRHTEDLARDVVEPDRFSWVGRTFERSVELAREFRTLVGTCWAWTSSISWTGRGWNWEERDGAGQWSVTELTSAVELLDESQAMRHCVASYVYRCFFGASSIFSVAFDGERRFTVEVDPFGRRVVQARGKHNRPCNGEELAVMQRWLSSLAARTARPSP